MFREVGLRQCCLPVDLLKSLSCSPCSTLLFDQSLIFAARLTSQTLLPVFTAPERINFKLAVTVYRCLHLHRTAPRYLSDRLSRVADMPSRSRLRSSTSTILSVRRVLLQLVNDYLLLLVRSYETARDDITSASSLPLLRRKLKKTHLFRQSYIVALFCTLFVVVLAMVVPANEFENLVWSKIFMKIDMQKDRQMREKHNLTDGDNNDSVMVL